MLEMLLPRLAPIAEVAWSANPEGERSLGDLEPRLVAQAARWERKGWPFYRSPQVQWPSAESKLGRRQRAGNAKMMIALPDRCGLFIPVGLLVAVTPGFF